MKLFKFITNYTFPNVCYYCQSNPQSHNLTPLCQQCALEVNAITTADGLSEAATDLPLNLYAGCQYRGMIRELILAFKNGHAHYLSPLFAKIIARSLERSNVQFDYIIPIPLHISRLLNRGFNQSALIAHHLGILCAKPVNYHLLTRRKRTAPLKSLPASRRRIEVQEAFAVTKDCIRPKSRLLLVDDVCTTGSTLLQAANSLQVAGFTKIQACVIARAQS